MKGRRAGGKWKWDGIGGKRKARGLENKSEREGKIWWVGEREENKVKTEEVRKC